MKTGNKMTDILHRIQINSSPHKVYNSIVTEKGLSGWWIKNVKTNSGVNSIAEFDFDSNVTKMHIDKLIQDQRVDWTCVDGPDEWINTHLFFVLASHGVNSILRFGHTGW